MYDVKNNILDNLKSNVLDTHYLILNLILTKKQSRKPSCRAAPMAWWGKSGRHRVSRHLTGGHLRKGVTESATENYRHAFGVVRVKKRG